MAELDIEAQERKAGSIARAALKASLINQIKRTFYKRTGDLLKSNVTARYKEARLDRLTIQTPKYSFTQHYGSTKRGIQKASNRDGGSVKSFTRHLNGNAFEVKAYSRKATTVKGFNKNRKYETRDHLTRVFKETNALEVLATSLGNNRITNITSQIKF